MLTTWQYWYLAKAGLYPHTGFCSGPSYDSWSYFNLCRAHPTTCNLSVFIDRAASGVLLKWSIIFFFVCLDFYYCTDMFSRVSPLMSLRLCSAILYPEIELRKLVCAVYIVLISFSVSVTNSKPHKTLLWLLLFWASGRMYVVISQFRKSVDIFQHCFHITVSPIAVTAG